MTIEIKTGDEYRKVFNAQIVAIPPGSMAYVKYSDNDDENVRYIPVNENWDIVNELIEKSLLQNIDFLWDRYKNNVIPQDAIY